MSHAKRTMDSRTKADNLTRKSRTTQARKDGNVKANADRRKSNEAWLEDEAARIDFSALLNPQPRKSNKGNGSPTRLSQVKRAVSRIGKTQQEV